MLLYATITPPLPKPEDWSSLFKLFIWLHKQTIPHNNPVCMAIHRESWMFVFFSPRKDKLSAHSYDIPSNAFRSRLPLHGIIPPLKMHFSNYKCKDSFCQTSWKEGGDSHSCGLWVFWMRIWRGDWWEQTASRSFSNVEEEERNF